MYVGKIKSLAYFLSDKSTWWNFHRDIEWIDIQINRKELSIKLQNTLRSSLTCFTLWEEQTDELKVILGYENSISNLIEKKVISEDLLFEGIRQKILELDATEFEILVSALLQTLWFEASHKWKVWDGGIDVEGTMNLENIAITKLQVQVKRYEKSIIGEKDIRNFRWALKKDSQWTFITLSDFDKKAKESANDQEKTIINLINWKKFVELFIKQYEEIHDILESDEFEEIRKKLMFKKTLFPL